LKTIFLRDELLPNRWRSFGRATAFLAIGLALTFACIVLLRVFLGVHFDVGHPSIEANLAGDALLFASSVLLPSLLLGRILREESTSFGWGVAPRGRQLMVGLVGGFGAMALLIAAMSLLGTIRFELSPQSSSLLLRCAIGYASIFALTALCEEGLLRGYVLIQLSRAMGFWPAAFVTSVIFAALHLVHGSETATGLLQVGLFGMVMAISVRKTQGLWFALGFHAAWDFSETFIFGVADSGMTGEGALLLPRIDGPAWLTGGSTGPEGSILVVPVLALAAVLIMTALPRTARVEV
jgi:hypothetical protein